MRNGNPPPGRCAPKNADEKTRPMRYNERIKVYSGGKRMEKKVFREKSVERISSPDELNAYMRVVSPSAWAVLAAVLLVLCALVAWSAFATVESVATGSAAAEGGVLTITFDDAGTAQHVEAGMNVTIGAVSAEITSVGRDARGRIIAGATANMPDGRYEARVSYKRTQILGMLLN